MTSFARARLPLRSLGKEYKPSSGVSDLETPPHKPFIQLKTAFENAQKKWQTLC